MLLPGLPTQLAAANIDFGYSIALDTDDYDLFAAAGSPTGMVRVHLNIEAGVRVRGTYFSGFGENFAIDCSGFTANSIVTITNYGEIRSHGGVGGSGSAGDADRTDSKNFRGGGGGGGNGDPFGDGGPNPPDVFYGAGTATDGSAGSDTYPGAGGVPGVNDTTSGLVQYYNGGSAGNPGGTCINGSTTATVYLLNYGTVWAGGGGGGGGWRNDDIIYGPYDGGGYGENGGGYGIQPRDTFNRSGHATVNVTILHGGSSPDMLGTNI